MEDPTNLKSTFILDNLTTRFFKVIKKGVETRFLYGPLSQMQPAGYIPIDYIAWALDPRVKSLDLMTSQADREAVWNHINHRLIEMAEMAFADESLQDSQQPSNLFSILNKDSTPHRPPAARRVPIYCVELNDYIQVYPHVTPDDYIGVLFESRRQPIGVVVV